MIVRPVPPGGVLHRSVLVGKNNGVTQEVGALFIGDQNKHRTVWLPVAGFETIDLFEIATAAALTVFSRRKNIHSPDVSDVGYPEDKATIDMRGSHEVQDDVDGDEPTLRSPQQRRLTAVVLALRSSALPKPGASTRVCGMETDVCSSAA